MSHVKKKNIGSPLKYETPDMLTLPKSGSASPKSCLSHNTDFSRKSQRVEMQRKEKNVLVGLQYGVNVSVRASQID